MRRLVSVITAAALMVVIMAASALPAFAQQLPPVQASACAVSLPILDCVGPQFSFG